MPSSSDSPLASVSFPRTGKRGVPQQFPRRLYEMLDSETKLAANSPSHPIKIEWSESGNAFRIHDVQEFAESVLPRYFRTKKFSSFQRNLNLYGFNKVRRGPEADYYTHPNFKRNSPESLLKLRKLGTASRRLATQTEKISGIKNISRPVSPSPQNSDASDAGSPVSITSTLYTKTSFDFARLEPLPSDKTPVRKISVSRDRGRLDLLAMALESHALAEAN